jgi:hypothetical protein
VTVENAGFDTNLCGDGDQRPALMALWEQVATGTLESADRVRLVGPRGELVLTRGLASTFTTQNTTLAFAADNGVAVTIDVRDGSGWLTMASKGTPFAIPDPADLDVWIINSSGDETVLRIEWTASGGCQPGYRLTIEPDVRRVWVEQLTPPGSDSLGGNCDVTLRFSRPVPANGIEARLQYPG